jgi:dipeptidyl aminopeptidase/acylaminoacyl peptidase
MQRRAEFSVGNQKLVGDLHLPEGFEGPFPCVITSHGYKSHREGEKYFQIGHRFPLEGISVLRFDHRGALGGESEGKFEDTTLTSRVEDLMAAIEFLTKIREIDPQRLGLVGSSLGGRTVLALPKDERIKATVLLATPIGFSRLRIEMKGDLEQKGYYQYPDGSRIKKEFYEDLARHNLPEEVKKINCPLLIIHGDLDEQVPRHQAFVLYQNANPPKELRMIEGADHAFTETEKLNKVLDLIIDWFKRYLPVT